MNFIESYEPELTEWCQPRYLFKVENYKLLPGSESNSGAQKFIGDNAISRYKFIYIDILLLYSII